jgi:hypothetical protein
MIGGDKVDYGKVVGILRYLKENDIDLVDIEYLPSQFFMEFSEGLELATFVDGGWATLTDEGKNVIDSVWGILCDTRELDPKVMYDSVLEFFKAQAEDAKVIPIKQGKKKKKSK